MHVTLESDITIYGDGGKSEDLRGRFTGNTCFVLFYLFILRSSSSFRSRLFGRHSVYSFVKTSIQL